MHGTEPFLEEREGQAVQRATTAWEDFSHEMLPAVSITRHECVDSSDVRIWDDEDGSADQFVMLADVEIDASPKPRPRLCVGDDPFQ